MQFTSSTFASTHITSILEAIVLRECTVKTIKLLLTKSQDLSLALLSYHTTPFQWCNLSASELMMGEKLLSAQFKNNLIPAWPYLTKFQEQEEK